MIMATMKLMTMIMELMKLMTMKMGTSSLIRGALSSLLLRCLFLGNSGINFENIFVDKFGFDHLLHLLIGVKEGGQVDDRGGRAPSHLPEGVHSHLHSSPAHLYLVIFHLHSSPVHFHLIILEHHMAHLLKCDAIITASVILRRLMKIPMKLMKANSTKARKTMRKQKRMYLDGAEIMVCHKYTCGEMIVVTFKLGCGSFSSFLEAHMPIAL